MRQKFFLKRVSVYLIMMLIPMTILLLAFSGMYLNEIEKSLQKQGKQTVEAVDVNFNLVLSNVVYQNDLLTSTTHMNISLRRILNLDEMTYADATNISSLRSILNSIQESHEYVDSIYIYMDSADRYFSSDKGIHMLDDSSDKNWIELYQEMEVDQNYYIVSRIMAEGTVKEKKFLTIYKRLLLQKGCIVVNININRLEDILAKQLSNQYETIYLVNQNGEMLASRSMGDIDQINEDYFIKLKQNYGDDWKNILEEKNGKWEKTESGMFMLNMEKYAEMDVIYISVMSYDAKSTLIFFMLRQFFVFLAVDLLIVIVLAYITTKRSFDQISLMIDMFDKAEKGEAVEIPKKRSQDEYDVIMNNVIYLFLNTNYLNSKLKENQYKREKAEIMALQLQINPHFLFNTLQTVEIEARKGNSKTEELCNTIQNVSDILKYALSDPSDPVTLKEELQYLKRYVSVQKFRFGDQFIIYYEVDEEVLEAQVFRLFLQPLVENSILHGIRRMKQKGYIKVYIQHQNNMLRCCVMDTGKGMSRQKVIELTEQINDESSKGIGITNLQRRLILRYGEQSTLRISSKEGMGTAISFYIPYMKNLEKH